MKLIDTVRAHLAAEEMSRQTLPYDLALAVVRVKRRTREDAEMFLQKERELVEKYAARDGDGNVRMANQSSFLFRDQRDAEEYRREKQALEDTDLGEPEEKRYRVKAPAEIRPEYLEALECFMEFVEDGK